MKQTSSTLAPNSKSVAALTAMVMASGATAAAQTDSSATAKDAAVQLPQVNVQAQQNRTVSSPKFTAPLVDTPQTVSIIPKEVFNQQGAASLADALGNTPGITFLAGEGGHVSGSNSFVMRGFDMSGNIFIDGVRDNGNYGRDIFNLEQIEVVKGPSGDNGRGSAAGYINLATKVPQATNFGSATASYGFDEYASIDRKRTTLDFNQTVADGAAVRVNALWQDGGVAGRDYAEKNTWGIAPSLALGLGQPTRAYLSYQHNEQDDRPDYGALGANLGGTATSVRQSRPADRSRFYGLTSDFDDVQIDVVSARLEHDLTSTSRLSNYTRWSKTDRDAIYTVPSAVNIAPDINTGQVIELVTTSRQAFYREIETISNQTNLASQFSAGGVDHSFAGGLELVRENGHTLRDFSGLGISGELSKTVIGTNGLPSLTLGTSPYNPNPNRPITGLAPIYAAIDDIRIDTAALYAYDTIRFSERWQASGGARLERYSARYDIRTVATGAVAPFEVEDTLLTGKLGVVFKPAREGSLYASWGLAAQPPGTNNLSNDNGSRNNGTPGTIGQNSPNADPVESYNYEVGVKWDFFQRKLTTSLSVFRSERTNIVVASDTNGIPTTFGDQTVEGVEFGVSGRITNNWIVFGGLNVLESENRNSANAAQNGSELNWTPEFSGNLWTTYRFPFGLTIGGGVQHTGESNVSLNSTTAAKLPAYTIVNAMIGYEVAKNLNLRLNLGNVSDKLYARAINNNSNRAYYGDPRTFLVSADYRF